MKLLFKCPACENKVNIKSDINTSSESVEFICSNCDSVLEWDESRLKYSLLIIILLIAVINLSVNYLFVFGFGLEDSLASNAGLLISGLAVAVYLYKSIRLKIKVSKEDN